MSEEPRVPLLGSRFQVWSTLKNGNRWMTVEDLASDTKLSINTVQTALTSVALDPRVVRRTGIRNNKRVTEYAFVSLINQIFPAGA